MAFMAPAMSFVAAFFRSVGVASGARRRVSRSCLFVFDFFTTLVLSVENIGLAGGPEATSAEFFTRIERVSCQCTGLRVRRAGTSKSIDGGGSHGYSALH